MADPSERIAIVRSIERTHRWGRQAEKERSNAPAARDRSAPPPRLAKLAAWSRWRQEAEIYGGGASFCFVFIKSVPGGYSVAAPPVAVTWRGQRCGSLKRPQCGRKIRHGLCTCNPPIRNLPIYSPLSGRVGCYFWRMNRNARHRNVA
jgi:hypothetical protein